MDFEEYAKRMTQKYQVAVAITVIRNKPDNLNPEQYISQLKEKIKRNDEEINNSHIPLTIDDDFDDNDFNIDDNDNSLNIVDFYKHANAEETLDQNADSINFFNNEEINGNLNQNGTRDNYNIDLRQHFNREETLNKEKPINDKKITTSSEASTDETNSLDDILKTLKDIDSNNKERSQRNDYNSSECYSQMIPSPSLINFSEDLVDENMTISDNIPNINSNIINLVDKSNTQVSADERLKAVVVNFFDKSTKTNKPDDTMATTNGDVDDNLEENIAFKNTYEMEVEMALNEILEAEPDEEIDDNFSYVQEKIRTVEKNITKDLNKESCIVIQAQDELYDKFNIIPGINSNQAIEHSTQDTILYTLHGFTQNTSYSQSQHQNIDIPKSFIYGNKDRPTNDDFNTNKNNENINVMNKDVQKDNSDRDKNISQDLNILTVDSSQIQYIIDEYGKTYAILNSIQLDKRNEETELSNKNVQAYKNVQASSEMNIKKGMHKQVKEKNSAINTQEDRQDANSQTNTETFEIDMNLDKDLAECEEVVPFKVVKELSKVKAFLSKRGRRTSTDGFSSDSGYRSDSQNSLKSVTARASDDWVHQSGNCLYNYITQCPLVAVTQEIVNEIAQVLGRLIDRLHEEEKYPLFLEELLEKVDLLLRELRRDSGTYEDILLEKDETIQRLLLLNKSTHILKFSIEKIVTNLEKVHSSLKSKENLYELINITEVENLRYTFYILEIFIQMYVKVKEASQNTQSSEETKILKKSSITEIWRKKWNPDFKETKNAGSQEKSCVLSKCGEILNKIIVDCMEGYGLVSYAALQCFNLLQS